MNAPAYVWRAALAQTLGADVVFDALLAAHVAFRIGGPADAYARIRTERQLIEVLRLAREYGVPITILGTGSNILVRDGGIRGITLKLIGGFVDIHVADGGEVEAGAGALNAQLVALLLGMGFVGLEFLATIPGTLGGALIMNAGAHQGEIKHAVRTVRLIDATLAAVERRVEDCGFAYRSSGFVAGEILTGVVLNLERGDAKAARAHLREMRAHRRKTQPIGEPNAGSIFKNPPGDFAGRLIEACGFKGRSQGGARIAERHANFIVNTGGARASDVESLAAQAARAVWESFGVQLEWEVRRLGEIGLEGPR